MQANAPHAVSMSEVSIAARKIMYKWPHLLENMPPALLEAGRAAWNSGRAARAWVNDLPVRT